MNCIGVDLGGTNIRAALVGQEGIVGDILRAPTGKSGDPDGVIGIIGDMIAQLVENAKSTDMGIRGVGIGVPGSVDPEKGTVLFAPNLQWRDINLAGLLGARCKLPIKIDNDVNMAAIGEYGLGSARNSSYALIMTLGTGIGGAFLENGVLLRGKANNACEIGHMVLKVDGPPCGCGRKGCFETLASATALLNRASQLHKEKNFDSVKEIFDFAKEGDEKALFLVEEMTDWLALGLANLLHIFNPDTVVIGGGVALAGDFLFQRIRAKTLAQTMPASSDEVRILPALLGDNAGILGSALVASEKE